MIKSNAIGPRADHHFSRHQNWAKIRFQWDQSMAYKISSPYIMDITTTFTFEGCMETVAQTSTLPLHYLLSRSLDILKGGGERLGSHINGAIEFTFDRPSLRLIG